MVSDEHVCRVCGEPAFVECFIYSVYQELPDVVMEQDVTCPFLCLAHFKENEERAFSEVEADTLEVTVRQIAARYNEGIRRMDHAITHSVDGPPVSSVKDIALRGVAKVPVLREHRGSSHYPYTNAERHQGFTIYRRIEKSSMTETQKRFSEVLKSLHDPALCNTDVEDVAREMGIPLSVAESIAEELISQGRIKRVGVGNNIAPA